VARAAFDAPGEDEFYAVDLIGCAAEDGDGGAVGAVTAVHDFGAGDVLEIAGVGGRTLYVAFTKAAVPEIELAQRRIVIDASATSIED
jgi:16S rRNA processing protein RimM